MSRRIGQSQLQQNGFTSGNNAKSGIAEPPFRKYSQMSDSKKGSGQFNRNAKDHFSLSGDEENEDRLDTWICELRRPFRGSQQQSNRPKESIVNYVESDSDDIDDDEVSADILHQNSQQSSSHNEKQQPQQPSQPIGRFTPRGPSTKSTDFVDVPTVSLGGVILNPTNESRIVAPNVSKLSPNSAVEIRLQSLTECVAVLCSVDVLKMRSGFFHDVLSEQEKSRVFKTALNSNGTVASTASSNDLLWREAITVPETSPFEAAAYLESLHEGRALFRGEWNHCWARLSVSWAIEDLILEYAAQIETHMGKLLAVIQANHWRTAPNVLAGMRVAVFRKGTNPMPTIVTGVAIECLSSIGYSKVRVAFDSGEKGLRTAPVCSVSGGATPLGQYHSGGSSTGAASNTWDGSCAVRPSDNTPPIIGDIAEPFWVQSMKEGSLWADPDDLFAVDARRLISHLDRKVFWEMARAVLELPELSAHCKTGIRNSTDLASVLRRPEYRVLWTAEAPECLPKDVATELIKAAYVSSAAAGSGGDN